MSQLAAVRLLWKCRQKGTREMTGIARYAMRDARIRETRTNEARILLHDEIQGYKDKIEALEANKWRMDDTIATLNTEIQGYKDKIKALEGEIASLKAEKRPVEASPKDAPISTPEAKEAPTQPSKATRKGGKK